MHFMGVLAQRTPTEPRHAMEVVVDCLATELTEWATTLEDPLLRMRSMMLVKEVLHGAQVSPSFDFAPPRPLRHTVSERKKRW